MNCPLCTRETKVSETRRIAGIARRRRHCACGFVFTTYETDGEIAVSDAFARSLQGGWGRDELRARVARTYGGSVRATTLGVA